VHLRMSQLSSPPSSLMHLCAMTSGEPSRRVYVVERLYIRQDCHNLHKTIRGWVC
jgi:hypothetical protein